MSKAVRIEPDLQFIKDLQEVGGESLKKCYQCATCSVACPLSPADAPYPRKEMIWAQWGLKDKLVNDIDIWLCHNCGQCSDLCPRGAKPGDLLAALRNMAYKSLVSPTIIGKWMSSSKYLPILVAIPAILWLFVWYLVNGLSIPEGEIVFGKIFPGDYTIDPIMSLTFFFMVTSFVLGCSKLIKNFRSTGGTYYVGPHENPCILTCIKDVLVNEVGRHTNFKDCGTDEEDTQSEERFQGHLFLFYSFVALAIVTGLIAFGHWGGKVIEFISPMGHTPLHLLNPIKILANQIQLLRLVPAGPDLGHRPHRCRLRAVAPAGRGLPGLPRVLLACGGGLDAVRVPALVQARPSGLQNGRSGLCPLHWSRAPGLTLTDV